jgi:hypothetical protein
MPTAAAIAFGFVLGLLFAALLMLRTLMSYVQSDLDGFRRWLDKREA